MSLLFLSNELINPHQRKLFNVPLEFIGFAYVKGKMYKHYNSKNVFTIPIDVSKTRAWGNNLIYGGLYILKDYDFYIQILDAYHSCSMYNLFRNHNKDIHHRVETVATPISFNTLNELSRLLYKELNEVEVVTYFGNTTHPKIKQRVTTDRFRITDGIDAQNFRSLWEEVN